MIRVVRLEMTYLKSAKRRLDTQREIVNHFSHIIPAFDDLFDERSWYIFFALLTIVSFLVAFILSRFVTVVDVDYDRTNHRRKGRFPGVRRTQLL